MKGFVVLAALVVCASAGGAYAQQPEAIEFWDKVRVGGKLCLADHEHYGESPSWPSERGARIMAIKKWEIVHDLGIRQGVGQLQAGCGQEHELQECGRALGVRNNGAPLPAALAGCIVCRRIAVVRLPRGADGPSDIVR